MCGIAGVFEPSPITERQALERVCDRMTDAMTERGPDGRGVWTDSEAGIALGHRRLAIIDLSPNGAQPMLSTCGRFALTYNGEIYNFAEIRAELRALGARFRGGSDTEVLVEACARWGVRAAVEKLVGMFAFALWDRRARALTLVRDRLGLKPLYWSVTPKGALIFGSELKALRAHPDCPREIDRAAAAAFLRRNCVPGPLSIYAGVQKLRPGGMLTLSSEQPEPRLEAYWRLSDVVTEGRADPFKGDDAEAVESLEAVLGEAVRGRMIADVPLGAFLSGGIDSSAVVALMQAAAARPVKSFSIGFAQAGYDEAVHAKAVAAHLGTDHTELYVSPEEAQALIPELPRRFDEPFADSSQIPTSLVSQLARRQVTVALSGDGGDELFAGYTRHLQARRLTRLLAWTPTPARRAAAFALKTAPPSLLNAVFRLAPASALPARPAEALAKLAAVLPERPETLYRRLTSHWTDPASVVIGAKEPGLEVETPDFADPAARMQYLDTLGYLPDDILTKVDRASMAESLEARAPILDHRVVAFAWRLPAAMKIRDGRGKWILRQLLYKHVPADLVDRPKAGFAAPLGDWLRGALRDWAEDLLSETSLNRFGLLRAEPVRAAWREHLSGRRDRQHEIWDVLMLQAWLAQQADAEAAPALTAAE